MADGGDEAGCVSFVFVGRPPSGNKNVGQVGAVFRDRIHRLHDGAGGCSREQSCYGVAYYFVRDYDPSRDADADNVAKRLWDALEGAAYRDDSLVRLRVAGLLEVGVLSDDPVHARDVDLTGLGEAMAELLLGLIRSDVRRFLYVEIGPARASMFAFDLASRA